MTSKEHDRMERLESNVRISKFVSGLSLIFTVAAVLAAWFTEVGAVSKVAALIGLCGLLTMLIKHRDAKEELEKLLDDQSPQKR